MDYLRKMETNWSRPTVIVKRRKKVIEEPKETHTLIVQAKVPGSNDHKNLQAKISINGKEVEMVKNKISTTPGLLVVAINGENGKIEFSDIFDPFNTHTSFDKFMDDTKMK